MTLSRIDAEAHGLLMQRRQSLWQSPVQPPEVGQEIAAIDEALGRIAQGSYGTCLACGGPLGLQRIRAIPEARYCVACSGVRASPE